MLRRQWLVTFVLEGQEWLASQGSDIWVESWGMGKSLLGLEGGEGNSVCVNSMAKAYKQETVLKQWVQ